MEKVKKAQQGTEKKDNPKKKKKDKWKLTVGKTSVKGQKI